MTFWYVLFISSQYTKRSYTYWQIEYDDGDVEQLVLSAEKIKFHLSSAGMQNLNLNYDLSSLEQNGPTYNEMLALAATVDDNQSLEHGDVVWAKLTGNVFNI